MFTVPEIDLQKVLDPIRAGEQLTVEAWDRNEQTRLAQGVLKTIDNQIDLATGTRSLLADTGGGANSAAPAADGGFDFDALGRVPVSAEGRTKPLDTFARNSVMVMSGRQTVGTERGPQAAIQWLADALAREALGDIANA